MTILKISFLAGGFIVLVFGIFGFKSSKWSRFINYTLVILGLLLLYVPIFGPLSGVENRVRKITEINSSQVESIVLQPSRRNEFKNNSIFDKDSIVVDRYLIQQYCESLNKAIELGWAYKNRMSNAAPRLRLCCRVEIHFVDKTSISFGVTKTEDATMISLNSDGEFGWHYANLDAYDFGTLLTESRQ